MRNRQRRSGDARGGDGEIKRDACAETADMGTRRTQPRDGAGDFASAETDRGLTPEERCQREKENGGEEGFHDLATTATPKMRELVACFTRLKLRRGQPVAFQGEPRDSVPATLLRAQLRERLPSRSRERSLGLRCSRFQRARVGVGLLGICFRARCTGNGQNGTGVGE